MGHCDSGLTEGSLKQNITISKTGPLGVGCRVYLYHSLNYGQRCPHCVCVVCCVRACMYVCG